ncbi:LacI family DNA-binding transcriptional regulator [Arthrobacter sp. H35-D1]|uniref:LacI family DNA-binding transcriptional regulator n=1 Tax=Arthrobacter sp. H35-D1 TaxID=3046202 RepID=UPI0024BBAFE3|nr:LacI family DNA-binding transcriptional regulator [Arthrobacter sp. H35-D1]MDJ0314352.1 LacI family DNA-binding transcriptional regulator [Arthrobacter sp. H35-D1]
MTDSATPPRRNGGTPLGVRMDDVAELAQVSRATVSRVIKGYAPVSSKTQEKVNQAMRELGYVPNLIASGLAAKGSDLVGLLLRDPRVPAYGLLHSVIQNEVSKSGLELITVVPSSSEGVTDELDSLHRLLGLRVGGLLVSTGVIKDHDLEPFLDSVPVVSVGRLEDHPRITGVSYDEDVNGSILADKVVMAGHRSVAVVVPAWAVSTGENRRGVAMASHLRGRGIDVHQMDTDIFGTWTDRCDDIIRLVRDKQITAAMFPTDTRALAFMSLAQAAGLSIPKDVSITGCDGIAMGLEQIGLATVKLPVEEVAVRATAVMAELLRNSAPGPVHHERHAGVFIPGRTLEAPTPGR